MTVSRTGENEGTQLSVTPTSARSRASEGLAPGSQVGEYRVDRQIGEGGMGIVFSAIHPVIGKRAAIKVLRSELDADPMTIARFVDEARAVNQIGHPNIVDIFAFGELEDGRHYFVMEWLQGMSLRDRIRQGRLPLADVCAIIRSLARALEAAHAHGIVHRDLKPDNVFLVDVANDAPVVKLLDFGIAKLTQSENRLERTESGAFVGTPQYIAPEQARGLAIDHRADIYALGGLLFELLTGRPPFTGDSAMVVVAKHLMEDPLPPSQFATGVPPDLDTIVLAMLAKDVDARPSLAALIGTVDRIGRSETLRTSQPTIVLDTRPHTAQPAPVQSRRWVSVAIAASLVAVSAVAFAIVSVLPTSLPIPAPAVKTAAPPPAAAVVAPEPPAPVQDPAPITPPAPVQDPLPITTNPPAVAAPVTKPRRRPHAPGTKTPKVPGALNANSVDDDATIGPSTP